MDERSLHLFLLAYPGAQADPFLKHPLEQARMESTNVDKHQHCPLQMALMEDILRLSNPFIQTTTTVQPHKPLHPLAPTIITMRLNTDMPTLPHHLQSLEISSQEA